MVYLLTGKELAWRRNHFMKEWRYSEFFAMNQMLRWVKNPRITESRNDVWLGSRTAGPVRGMFSSPSISTVRSVFRMDLASGFRITGSGLASLLYHVLSGTRRFM